MNNLISIIIPVYNMERYISACLDSILSQDYRSIELILVDDGSKDSTRKILTQYAEQDSRIKLIFQENRGVSWATYNGYKASTGDFICFSDHDDVFLPGMLSHLMEMLSDEVDIACCSRIDLHDEELKNYNWQGIEKITVVSGRTAIENTIKPVDYNLQLPLWGRIYRKSFLDKFDFLKYADLLPTLFMVDIFIIPQVLFSARKVAYTNRVYYIHREVGTSISRSLKLSPFYFEQIDSFPILLEFYKKNGLLDLYKDTLRQYANSCLMRLYYKIRKSNYEQIFKTEIFKKIESNFSRVFNDLHAIENKFVYKLSYSVFEKCKWFWCITFGSLYFNFIKKIK